MSDFEKQSFLVLTAVVAGIINSLAGGGTLLTFPALAHFGMIRDLVANMTNTIALVPGSLAGTWGYRREFRVSLRWVWLLTPPSLAGGVTGALLLTRLDESYFDKAVPWLILTATLLFLSQPLFNQFAARHADQPAASRVTLIAMIVFQFFVAVYGGYFGAGMGILMLSSLGLMGLGDIHRMNAVKSFLAVCINGISVVVFVIDGTVAWRFVPTMAVAAIVGGYLGAHYGRKLNRNVVRWIVVGIGFALSAYYFATKYGWNVSTAFYAAS
jgi:uncharacterized membrane protein YfcA